MKAADKLTVAILVVPPPDQVSLAGHAVQQATRAVAADPDLAECVSFRVADLVRGHGVPSSLVQQLVLHAATCGGVVIGGFVLVDETGGTPATTGDPGPSGVGEKRRRFAEVLDACEGAGLHVDVRQWPDATGGEPGAPHPGSGGAGATGFDLMETRSGGVLDLSTDLVGYSKQLLNLAAGRPELLVSAAKLVQAPVPGLSRGLRRTAPSADIVPQRGSRSGVLDSLRRLVRTEETPSLLDVDQPVGHSAELWYLLVLDGYVGGQARWARDRSAALLDRWGAITPSQGRYFSVISGGKQARRDVTIAPLSAATARMAPRPRDYGLDLGAVCRQACTLRQVDVAALDRRGICVATPRILIVAGELPLADSYGVDQYRELCLGTQVVWLLPESAAMSSQEFGPPRGLLVSDHADAISEIVNLLVSPFVDPRLPRHASPDQGVR